MKEQRPLQEAPRPRLPHALVLAFAGSTAAISAAFAWRIATKETPIICPTFDFTDLLSLLMSVFSIALAVAFYFKATDTSNEFYNNSYLFTKEMSEILGRIEAGFGERLKHLDEGYSGLRERFDRLPFEGTQVGKELAHEVQVEEKKVEETEEARRQLIAELLQRAQVEERERARILEQFREKDLALTQARSELESLRQQLKTTHEAAKGTPMHDEAYVRLYTRRKVIERLGGASRLTEATREGVQEFWVQNLKKHPRSYISDMRAHGFVDITDRLTPEGIAMVVQEAAASLDSEKVPGEF